VSPWARPRARPSRRVVSRGAIAALVPVLWVLSLPGVDLTWTSGFGLLTALPVLWWLAVAAAVVPYLLAAFDPRCPTWILGLHQAGLVLLLFGTTSAVYPAPRFPWTYKHLGVVEHVLSTGGLDRSLDIYNNWPGLFLLAAGVHEATGLPLLAMARWAEPVFGLLFSAGLWWAVRALTRDRRVVAVTVLVFTLANWIAQNYFSPQALAFVLALFFLGVVLRVVPLRDGDGRIVLRRPVAHLLRLPEPEPAPGEGRPPDRRALAVAVLLFTAIVVTHQLTPLAVLLQLAALAAVARVRHRWLFAVCAALEAGWLTFSLGYVSEHWNLFSPGLVTPSDGLPVLAPALPGMALMHLAPTLLVGLVGLAAMAATAHGLMRSTAPVVPAALAVVSPVLLAVQSYGGEGVLRVYLYGLPWLSYLIGERLVAVCGRGRIRTGLAAAGVGVTAALSLASMLGSELGVQVDPGDVAASRWFEGRTPAGAYPVTVTEAGFPLLLTAGYPGHLRAAVVVRPAGGAPLGSPSALLQRARAVFAAQGPGGYLAITASQYTFARMHGLATPQELDRVAEAVVSSPDYRVVRREGRDLLARYVGP
jgi:hypothetical protein